MKTTEIWGFFRKAWLCPCLISLLTSCAVLQKPAQEQPRYRVTLSITSGKDESEIASVLTGIPVSAIDIHQSYMGIANGFQPVPQTIQLTLTGEPAVRQLQQQLQTAGIVVTAYHIQKLD